MNPVAKHLSFSGHPLSSSKDLFSTPRLTAPSERVTAPSDRATEVAPVSAAATATLTGVAPPSATQPADQPPTGPQAPTPLQAPTTAQAPTPPQLEAEAEAEDEPLPSLLYTTGYVDPQGRRVGDAGFQPPALRREGRVLSYGQYDDYYRDEQGRRPGEAGFVPPLLSLAGLSTADMPARCPDGYDVYYVDGAGRTPLHPLFRAPVSADTPPKAGAKQLVVEISQATFPADVEVATVVLGVGQHKEEYDVRDVGSRRLTFTVTDEEAETLHVVLLDADGQMLGMYRQQVNELPAEDPQEVSLKMFMKKRDGQWVVPEAPQQMALTLTAHSFGTPSPAALGSAKCSAIAGWGGGRCLPHNIIENFQKRTRPSGAFLHL